MGKVKAFLILAVVPFMAFQGNLSFCTDTRESHRKPKIDVPYEPTSHIIARAMLSMAKVSSSDLVYDLGCGDGRIVIMAAKELGARGVGVDIDPERIKESVANAGSAGVSEKVRFIEQDLFKTDISDATVVMLYLWPDVNLKLRPKLLRELKPGTRIVSHSHSMGAWRADATQTVEKHNLYYFIVPANISGSWLWTGLAPNPTRLRIVQSFQDAKGMVQEGGNTPFLECVLEGNAVRCLSAKTTKDGKVFHRFEGHVSGDVIEGKITNDKGELTQAKAKRDPGTMVPIAE